MRPDEDEDKFDHDPDGTGWELNTSEMTPKHMRDIPRRIRCLPFDVPWSQKTADSLAEEVALVVEMALLPPNAGADIAAKAGVNAALANLGRALKAEARIEALGKERDEWEAATRNLLEHYPEDVFPPNSNTPDAKAGTFARRLLTWLLDPVERTRLAALVAEEPMQPTMYPGSSALREWADLHGEQGGGS